MTLRLEPSGQIVQVWEIAYRDLLNGWNSFSPPPIVDEENEVLLEIAWSERIGAPAIGLSVRHWNEPYGVLTASHAGGCQGLAMRIWSGLQGVRSPMLVSTPKKGAEAKGRLVAYPPGDLARLRQYKFAETQVRDYASVCASTFPGRVMTHPHAGGPPTIAIFSETLPAGVTFVGATCQTMNPEAPLIEYAMAIVPSDVAPEAVFDCDEPGGGFSGWWSIGPMEPKRIQLVLDTPATGDERLCFATRLPPGSSEHDAWATWTGVELGIGWRPEKPILKTFEQPKARWEKPIPGREGTRVSVPPIVSIPPEPNGASPEVRMNDVGAVRFAQYSPGDLTRLRQYKFAETQVRDYASVCASTFPGRVMTHPHAGGPPTIAIFSETLPAGVTFVGATCQTMNPEAPLIEYAMAIVPSDVAPEAVFDCDEPGGGFSGWWSIGPMEPKRIQLVLDTPATGDERLCFAT